MPQGSVIGLLLYLLYTYDIPQPSGMTVATFADDTATLAVGNSEEEATNKLQNAVNKINNWTKKWRIKLNENKSVQIFFTNKKIKRQTPITINGTVVPYSNMVKYLGMTLVTSGKLHDSFLSKYFFNPFLFKCRK